MRRTGLWWAAAVVVLANLGAWGAAIRNRSGDVQATLVLTERELRLPEREADNTAIALSIVIDGPRGRAERNLRDAGWFDREKLASIGFDCSRPVTAGHAEFYRTRPPRRTFAALEYQDAPLSGTRLVPIDVDNDPDALRRRHPDRGRVAIMEATAAMLYLTDAGRAPFLAGRVTSVQPGRLNVPRQWIGLLRGLQSDEPARIFEPLAHDPRYLVTVAWGQRLEPWIVSIELGSGVRSKTPPSGTGP